MMGDGGNFTVRFWGVRGSYPTPGSSTTGYGGNTACVEIQAGGHTLILDAGTGIIGLGRALVQTARETGSKVRCVLLFSHLHHDHTQGFPFFTPAFIPGSAISVIGPDLVNSNPLLTLETIMQPPYFPLRLNELNADFDFHVLHDSEVLRIHDNDLQILPAGVPMDHNSVWVRSLRSYAHPGGVLHYRIDWRGASVVYATDTEGYVNGDRRLAAFARNADLLIHDAQYTDEHYLGLVPGLSVTQGFGHSTISMACQAAFCAGVRQLALFHHAPEYSDQQLDAVVERARQIFPDTFAAREGMELHLAQRDEPEDALIAVEPARRLNRRH